MRVGHLQPTRPEWYDRNPLTLGQVYQADAVSGGAGGTARWSYTVPAGKKCYIDGLMAYLYVAALRTAGGFHGAVITYIAGGGAGGTVDLLNLRVYDNVRGAGKEIAIGAQGMMQAGDRILGSDYSATTGTYDTETVAKLTQYDA